QSQIASIAHSVNETTGLRSSRSEKLRLTSFSGGTTGSTNLQDSGNWEIGRNALGISLQLATMPTIAYKSSWMIAAGDQIVAESGISPMTFCRKCPCVATKSGPLDDNPNCHSAWAPDVTASKNGKSIGSLRRSASVEKKIAMMGPSAYPSPQ